MLKMVEIKLDEFKVLVEEAQHACDECVGSCDKCIVKKWEEKIKRIELEVIG